VGINEKSFTITISNTEWDGTTIDTSWYDVSASTYNINTGAQMAGLADLTGGTDFTGKTITQTTDIDLKGFNWTPTGNFNGTYNGANKTISGLTINASSGSQGLFTSISSAGIVENLRLTGVNIIYTGTDQNDLVGGITGRLDGKIENCSVSGSVQGYYDVGGLVGINIYGEVLSSYNNADVFGNNLVGGLVGENRSGVFNCYNTGNITAVGGTAGGIVSQSWSYVADVFVLNYCYNTGTVTGSNAGGVAGYIYYSSAPNIKLENCVSLGVKVTGISANRIVGVINGSVSVTNNQARMDIVVGPSGSEFPVTEGADENGIGIDLSTSPSLSAVFNGWDTGIWDIPAGNLIIGGALPTLKNMTQSPAPVLP